MLRDSAVNQFVGGSGLDWFWLSQSAKVKDLLRDFAASEIATFE